MDPARFTRRGRKRARELMTNECVVKRATGAKRTDPVTGKVTPEVTEVYAGPCKLQSGTAANKADTPLVASKYFVVEGLVIQFPLDESAAPPFVGKPKDEVTITKSSMDASLVGLRFTLTELARGEYRTAARWSVDLVTE